MLINIVDAVSNADILLGSIATEVYDKDSSRDSSNSGAAGGGSKPNMKLTRVGEAVLDGGKWCINDEAVRFCWICRKCLW